MVEATGNVKNSSVSPLSGTIGRQGPSNVWHSLMNDIFLSGMNFIILYTSARNHPFYGSAYSLCLGFMFRRNVQWLGHQLNTWRTKRSLPKSTDFSVQSPGSTEPKGHGASFPSGEMIMVLSSPSNAWRNNATSPYTLYSILI